MLQKVIKLQCGGSRNQENLKGKKNLIFDVVSTSGKRKGKRKKKKKKNLS